MKKLLLIDGNALLHRGYHALPALTTAKGELVNAAYGFTSMFFNAVGNIGPDYAVVTFDVAAPTFRALEYPEYKAKRVKAPQELYDQLVRVKQIAAALALPVYEQAGFEADDLIATIVFQLKNKELEIFIMTGDLDTLQLISEKVKVYLLKGVSKAEILDEDFVHEKYGLAPAQVMDFKGLKGDASDNILGVPAVGEKTALELVKRFGNLENLYAQLGKSDVAAKLKARLLEYKEQAFFSKYLATVRTDVPIDFDLEKARWGSYDKEKAIKFFAELEFKSLIKKLENL